MPTSTLQRFALAAALVAFVPLPAHAQLGGLAKKMKDKAMEKVADKAADKAGLNNSPPTYDDVILELTPERIDALVKGLAVQKQVLEANGGVAALMKQHDELDKQATTLRDRAGAVSNGYYNATNRWDACATDIRSSLEKSHEDEARRMAASMMANPTGQGDRVKKANAAQQEMAKALAANDTVAMHKWTVEFYKAWGIDLSKDDAAIAAKCGARPPKPAAMLELDKVEAQRDTIEKKARALETRAVLEGSKAAGMSEQQFAMARERAEMALGGTRTRFSKGELAALDARKGELTPLIKK